VNKALSAANSFLVLKGTDESISAPNAGLLIAIDFNRMFRELELRDAIAE
jgi:hypothetical protein